VRLNRQGTYREGRSSPGVRVNATVTPQHRVRSSAADGRHVLVKSGPYKGLIGEFEICAIHHFEIGIKFREYFFIFSSVNLFFGS
jgi:hypothetical protein